MKRTTAIILLPLLIIAFFFILTIVLTAIFEPHQTDGTIVKIGGTFIGMLLIASIIFIKRTTGE